MSKFIDRPRFTCALGGAMGTLHALPRTVTIVHASAGCGGNLNNAINASSGYLGGGYCGGQALPSSNVVEQDVVFGGEARLREQIESTLEIVDGDLYVVVTGCMVDMIGDDTVAVAGEFNSEETPVLGILTPSFKGNGFTGYELVVKGLASKYIRPEQKKDPYTVNVLGIVPAFDIFWKGNLREIKRLLSRLGLKVNTFFGEGETLEDLRNCGNAALNIVVSNNVGIDAAQHFQEVHDIPYLVTPFPIGALASERMLRDVAKALTIPAEKVDAILKEEKELYYDYFFRIADIMNDSDLQRHAIVVGDSNYAPAVTRFVSDELGWLPELVMMTDDIPQNRREYVGSLFKNFNSGIEPHVYFDTDASSVKKYLREVWPRNDNSRYYDPMTPTVVFGGSFERNLAEEFGYSLVPVSYPLTNRCVMNKAYAGFNGGLTFTEDTISNIVSNL
jgi:nitrogenase molybdenum-iron protein beta chain